MTEKRFVVEKYSVRDMSIDKKSEGMGQWKKKSNVCLMRMGS